jgi:hypothetical protein
MTTTAGTGPANRGPHLEHRQSEVFGRYGLNRGVVDAWPARRPANGGRLRTAGLRLVRSPPPGWAQCGRDIVQMSPPQLSLPPVCLPLKIQSLSL